MAEDGMDLEIDLDETITERVSRLDIKLPDSQKIANGDDSIASIKSILIDDIEAVIENDRRYANQSYYLPSDESEEIRASIMHQMYLTALSGHLTLHRLPRDISRILDVGAGPGDWAIAIAEAHPRCEVVATDIWPFQPAGVPPNLTYQLDDARLQWDFDAEFDFIHIRGLAGAFHNWVAVLEQVFAACSTSGHVEIIDLSLVSYGIETEGTALGKYNAALLEAASIAGTPFGLEHLQEQMVKEAGFRIFRKTSIEIPIGQWKPDKQQKALGKLALVAILEGLEAQSLRLLTTHLDRSAEEVLTLCNQVKKEIMAGDLKPSVTCRIVVLMKLPGMR